MKVFENLKKCFNFVVSAKVQVTDSDQTVMVLSLDYK